MAGVDRTQMFRIIVKEVALRDGYDQAKVTALTAATLVPAFRKASAFGSLAAEILKNIQQLQALLVRCRKDYVDSHRTSERERDAIECEVAVSVKLCREGIDLLKERISILPQTGDTGGKGPGPNVHVVAHRHGVALVLSERLHELTALFDKLRGLRYRALLDSRTSRRRRPGLPGRPPPEGGPGASLASGGGSEAADGQAARQQQLIDDDTRALQAELLEVLDNVRSAESKALEVSALNHLMSSHVLQQAQQIELLYQQAVDSANNISKGNHELEKAVGHSKDSYVFLIMFLVIATLGLLFLDWYSSL